MDKSITLLERALRNVPQGELASEIGVNSAALSNSKKIGQLSPLVAGQLAVFLNENVEHWMAVAAAESARDGKAKRMLLKHLADRVKS